MKQAKIQNYSNAESKCREEIFNFLRFSLGKNFDENLIFIEYPPDASMGDFSITCFGLAKKAGVSPNEFTKSLAEQFTIQKKVTRDGRIIRDAKSFGPYLNFFVDYRRFAKNVINQILKEKKDFGNSNIGKGQKIMIEYSQPNTHKEFHIGHLRNVCIGFGLVQLYKVLGYKVISANYIGDIGAHVAKCLWAYTKFHYSDALPKNKGKFLGEIYVEANKKLKENEEYKKEVSEILQKLEAGDKKLTSLWKKTRKWSLNEFYSIYKNLGVAFDVYFFESEVEEDGKKIVAKLLKDGVAKKSEGAVIIDLEAHGLKQFLLLKSDKTSLYSTKDLALAQIKFKKYGIDKSFYVVDMRQSFYFQQLFKTLEIMGVRKAMAHVPYEFVTLKESAMSSRSGNIVLFEDFEGAIMLKVEQETRKRHNEWKEGKIKNVSMKISHAAMKYSMLSHGNNSVIVFDMERSLALHGDTGPYLQYVYARISGILKKVNTRGGKILFEESFNEEEMNLARKLSRFPKILELSAETFDPSLLSHYLYELAQIFSVFYEKVPVLAGEPKMLAQRLAILRAVRAVFTKGLKILGIEPLEQM